MLLNYPKLTARVDLRTLYVLGALLGGDKSRDYISTLAETAYDDDPQRAEITREMVRAADAKRSGIVSADELKMNPEYLD